MMGAWFLCSSQWLPVMLTPHHLVLRSSLVGDGLESIMVLGV
jgi:hypothetical protein